MTNREHEHEIMVNKIVPEHEIMRGLDDCSWESMIALCQMIWECHVMNDDAENCYGDKCDMLYDAISVEMRYT